MIKEDQIEDFISPATLLELNKKVLITAIIDNLTSNDPAAPLSANQGKVLKGLIDTINTVLQSDDGTLDELQEIVAYIKQNKTDLQNLAIANIAGLTQALADAEANANAYTDQEIGNVTPVRTLKLITTTTYAFVAEDATKWLRFTNVSGCTVTVPDTIFTAEQELMGDAKGGNVIFSQGTGFTLNKAISKKLEIPKEGVFGMRLRAANEAVIFGSLKPI